MLESSGKMNQGKITGSDRLSQGKEWLTAYLLNAIYLLTPYLPLFMLYLQLETAAPEATLLHQTPLIIQGFSKKPISISLYTQTFRIKNYPLPPLGPRVLFPYFYFKI